MGPDPALEWPSTLTSPALIASGWRPVPFREFIVKVHSRCDLSCDYCYMFEMADQSWHGQPKRMSTDTAETTAKRIGEHARAHGLSDVTLILHGGEPLLAGESLIWALVEATRKAAGPEVNVGVRIQTNGVGLNDAYLRLFDELDVRVESASTATSRRTTSTAASPAGAVVTPPWPRGCAAATTAVHALVRRTALHHRPSQRPNRHL